MAKLQLFAQLMKVDVANRRITGVIASEAPDASNEVLDYASSKQQFVEWSNNLAKTSGGKNLGNLRVMHGLTAAGHLVELTFDDEVKKILATAEITDDDSFNKVLKGTYTGFSVGGKYLRKWRDGDNTRYTAKPREVSLVDAPCIPDATFDLVKADGAVEHVHFAKPEGAPVAPTKVDPFAVVRDNLQKIAKRDDTSPKEGEGKYGNVEYADATNKKYPIDTPEHIRAAWNYINKSSNAGKYGADDVAAIKKKIVAAWKSKIDKAGPPSADDAAKCDGPHAEHFAMLDCVGSMLMQKINDGDEDVLAGLALAKETIRGEVLQKGMWTCASLCNLLQSLQCIHADVACEARYEDDGSPLPADLTAATKEIGRILVSMVEEEVEEMTECIDDQNMALASKSEDLLKAAQDELGANKIAAADLQKRFDDLQKTHTELEAKFKTSDDDLKKANLAITESTAALAKINGEVNDLKKVIGEKDVEIGVLKGKVKAPALMIVDKANDVLQQNGDVKKVVQVETGGEVDAAATLIKAIHATGGQRAAR